MIAKKNTRVNKELGRFDIVDRLLTLTYPTIMSDGKYKKAMTIGEACKELGISYRVLGYRRKTDPVLAKKWDEVLANRKEYIQNVAKENIFSAIEGNEKGVRTKDKVEWSFRLLEKTDKEFQPKQSIELKSTNLDFNVSLEELERRANDLINNK